MAEAAAAVLLAVFLMSAACRENAPPLLIGLTVTYCALVGFSLVSLIIQRMTKP